MSDPGPAPHYIIYFPEPLSISIVDIWVLQEADAETQLGVQDVYGE